MGLRPEVTGTDEEMGTATALDTGTAAFSANPAPRRIECHYDDKNPEWGHTGRKTSIRMNRTPKYRFV